MCLFSTASCRLELGIRIRPGFCWIFSTVARTQKFCYMLQKIVHPTFDSQVFPAIVIKHLRMQDWIQDTGWLSDIRSALGKNHIFQFMDRTKILSEEICNTSSSSKNVICMQVAVLLLMFLRHFTANLLEHSCKRLLEINRSIVFTQSLTHNALMHTEHSALQ